MPGAVRILAGFISQPLVPRPSWIHVPGRAANPPARSPRPEVEGRGAPGNAKHHSSRRHCGDLNHLPSQSAEVAGRNLTSSSRFHLTRFRHCEMNQGSSSMGGRTMPKISEARILIMATDGFEQAELLVPLKKLREAG